MTLAIQHGVVNEALSPLMNMRSFSRGGYSRMLKTLSLKNDHVWYQREVTAANGIENDSCSLGKIKPFVLYSRF